MEWVKKYMPKTSSEIIGQSEVISQVKGYIQNFSKGMKPVLLCGPPGVGKTSSVYALANELGLEVVEVNASDVRNKASIEEVLGGAIGQMSLLAKGKIILLDEVDGLSGTKDRGGLPAVIRLMEKSSFPIIMTANDPYKQKFSALRKKCKLLELNNLDHNDVFNKLKKIAKEEKVVYEEEALKTLARKQGGDLRAAINDLQTLGKVTKKDVDIVGDRERKETIFQALMKVFKTTKSDIARDAYNDVDIDISEIFLWIEQNIPIEYKKPKDIARAYDNLSKADVFFGRIRKWQHYRFYVYCYDLLSAGIALSKDEKYPGMTKYERSTKPLKIWMTNNKLAKKKSIAGKLAERTHTSTRAAMQVVPLLRVAAQRNEKFSNELKVALELDEPELEWIHKV